MKVASSACAVIALLTGLTAARYWYRSSRVAIDPGWGLPGTGVPIEPVEPEARQMDLALANIRALTEAGDLNKRASLWTAASVVASALSSVLGSLG